MPFVPFTGVNHHYQSVLFGFVLMRDELKTTFEWVFGTWLEVVEGKAHLAIITDQDQAMVGEIQSQLPNMTHLLCLWHISNKFPEKLSTYYAKEEFKGDFNNCIYHSLTEEIFEDRWKALILKYKLEDNTWLQGLYNLKHKWIDAYTRNIFFAGQKTTSRSEGMNAFFDAYVGSCMGLKEFVEGAQKALERQFMREKEEDYNTHHKICYMRLKTALEQHAASIYTKDMFKKFQDQLVEAAKYFMEKDRDRSFEDVEDTYYKCYRPLMVESKRTTYLVTFYKLSFRGSCICRMFEHSGMSCRHIIIVLTKRMDNILPGPVSQDIIFDNSYHVSLDVWEGHERSPLECYCGNRNMRMWVLSDAQKDLLHSIGFGVFANPGVVLQNDVRLVTTLVEGWRPETNTFFMRHGK
ncbi:protein FAR1-RELATED SEQUENCE 5-like [Apium graveolens]|uniref:protein FAR1-RELATED SEQUENCE 5-like n=1 Tax=Apium graveolens TaxID=4045 RepID=UPI003D7B1901